ncbi:MAG: hypothetical protein M1840_008963 [Geoglossum simile]|nr:MAG: hypothetical protein M1840_008963 [Geoglossum simile]
MKLTTSLLALNLLATPALAESVLGVAVFTRHGDRTSKHYPGFQLTNLGFTQNFHVGSDYRARYLTSGSPQQILGISEFKYVPSQVHASAPDQQVLMNAATAFLQGLYPPLNNITGSPPSIAEQTLSNGTSSTSPLNGYQYAVLHSQPVNSPDTIWIKGDDECPAHDVASNSYSTSAEYINLLQTTKPFYQRLWSLLKTVPDYTLDNMSYANAYDIFDLIHVSSIHNSSFPTISPEDFHQVRTLADTHEFASNFNATEPLRAISGETLAAIILSQLNKTVTSKGKLKFSILAGSYDTFLSFFGLANLTSASPNFFGLPEYASTMAFELLTSQNASSFPVADLAIRFLFRNGSDQGPLTPFPLFGRTDPTIPWQDFVTAMSGRAIRSVDKWCSACQSTADFCPLAPTPTSPVAQRKGGMSKGVAGVIGAMTAVGAFLLLAAVSLFLVTRRRRMVSRSQSSGSSSLEGKEDTDATAQGVA